MRFVFLTVFVLSLFRNSSDAQKALVVLDTSRYTSEVLVGQYTLGAGEIDIFGADYLILNFDQSLVKGNWNDETGKTERKVGSWYLNNDSIHFRLKQKYHGDLTSNFGVLRFRLPPDSLEDIILSTSIVVLTDRKIDVLALEEELLDFMQFEWRSMLDNWEENFTQDPNQMDPLDLMFHSHLRKGQIARAFFNRRNMYCRVKEYLNGMH